MQAAADVGLLISVLHDSAPHVWQNIEHTIHAVNPRFSSLAVDLWSRMANTSALHARQNVYMQHAPVLALFSRVLFLDTASRASVPSHVRPSFSYRIHWHTTFSDYASSWPFGAHAEGLPTLLVGVDADVYVPKHLPLHRLADVLGEHGDTDRATLADVAQRANDVWLHGQKPPCAKASAAATPESAAGRPARQQLCEVVSTAHRPIWASPRDLASLQLERRRSYGELGMYLHPLGLGNCCGRQNEKAPDVLRQRTGATVATLSRGPYCPSSTFFVAHRRHLPRLLHSFRFWQEAWDARALTRDTVRLRWEYVACSLLAPGEAVLLLHYNHSQLEAGACEACDGTVR